MVATESSLGAEPGEDLGLVRSRGARWAAGMILGLAALAAIAYLAFKVAPDWFAETKGLDPKGRADARQGVRTASLALFAGLIAIVGSVYTARTFGLNRAGQITDRFTKAVGQLGDDKTDVRLGGIYALERIAHDSKDDHPQVIEVLTAFVRTHAPWPRSTDRQPSDHATAPSPVILPTGVDSSPQHSTAPVEEPHPPATDVQAALTVIGRRTLAHERKTRPPLLLSSTDLRRANLRRANLSRADLEGANLSGANLSGAGLREADLGPATNLSGADLSQAYLRANLRGADVSEADLSEADLSLANLRGADLEGANLREARYDAGTQWPEGFDPDAHGAVRAEK